MSSPSCSASGSLIAHQRQHQARLDYQGHKLVLSVDCGSQSQCMQPLPFSGPQCRCVSPGNIRSKEAARLNGQGQGCDGEATTISGVAVKSATALMLPMAVSDEYVNSHMCVAPADQISRALRSACRDKGRPLREGPQPQLPRKCPQPKQQFKKNNSNQISGHKSQSWTFKI